MNREVHLLLRTIRDLNRPVFWMLVALICLGLLALGPGVAVLGVSAGGGTRGLQQLFVSVLFPLVVLSVPLFHQVSRRAGNELDFRRIQIGTSPLTRATELSVYGGLILLPLGLTGVVEYGLYRLLDPSPGKPIGFWVITLGLVWGLVFLGRTLAPAVDSLFEAAVLVFVVWLVMVLGWDGLMIVLVVLEVPSEVTNTLAVLNPVSLYRFELYRVLPELRPALEGHLPGSVPLWGGRLLWGVVLPSWVILRGE